MFSSLATVCSSCTRWAVITQSVLRLATGWTVWGSNPGGQEIFRTRPDPVAYPASDTVCTASFLGGRGVELTNHPYLAPRLMSRAVLLLSLGGLIYKVRHLMLPILKVG